MQSAKSLLVIFVFVVVVASPAIENPTTQVDMSNREASTPAVDWESKSVSSLTTVLVSNKVTPASDTMMGEDIGTFDASEVPSATAPSQQDFETSPSLPPPPLAPPGDIYGPDEDVSTVTEPTNPGVLPNPAVANPVIPAVAGLAVGPDARDDFHASAGRAREASRTAALEADNGALRKQLEAALEENANLKARLEAHDGSSGGQKDPPDDKKEGEDDDDDNDKEPDSKPSATPFPNQGK